MSWGSLDRARGTIGFAASDIDLLSMRNCGVVCGHILQLTLSIGMTAIILSIKKFAVLLSTNDRFRQTNRSQMHVILAINMFVWRSNKKMQYLIANNSMIKQYIHWCALCFSLGSTQHSSTSIDSLIYSTWPAESSNGGLDYTNIRLFFLSFILPDKLP